MTRFARAKGSKSSNERLPNESTPWSVMKQQLQEAIGAAPKENEKQVRKSAKQLLAEHQDSSNANENSEWAEFDGVRVPRTNKKFEGKKAVEKKEKILKKKKSQMKKEVANNIVSTIENDDQPVFEGKNKNVNKKKRKLDSETTESEEKVESGKSKKVKLGKSEEKVESGKLEEKVESRKLKEKVESGKRKNNTEHPRKKKKKKMEKLGEKEDKGNDSSVVESNGVTKEGNKSEGQNSMLTKRQKRNLKHKLKPRTDQDIKGKGGMGESGSGKKRKPPKIRDDKEHKRRKPDVGIQKMVINGVELEIVKFDGFPVRKEDADRLKELREKMIIKGIPKSEVNAAMKLERRKAEKALARIRRCVCFHCRKSGHNLSECPDLGNEEIVTGICFKCGSTEHTHYECKAGGGQNHGLTSEYRFTKCFICREQGHVAKQCPDNPKGLYPQGGACKLCGDVTHLRKDCPSAVQEKEENAITLDTINVNSNLESIDAEAGDKLNPGVKDKTKSKKKIVKF